MEGLNQ